MHIENDKIVLGKLETFTIGMLIVNFIATVACVPIITTAIGIVGGVVAVGALTFRYIKNHSHNH